MATDSGIDVLATVNKVTTLADGGLRITLDLSEDKIMEAAWFMQIKQGAGVVHLTAELADTDN